MDFVERCKWKCCLLVMVMVVGGMFASHAEDLMYEVELERWGIYNDGSHAIETTKGLNEALKWASGEGYKVIKIPSGTYLIAKGKKANDPEAHIRMVSNMTLWLDDQAIMQKESNSYPGYSLLQVGPGVKNVILKGGTYRGDKDTHSYAGGGTHEGGYGIIISGENVTVDSVKVEKFTGDGISIGSFGSLIDEFYAADFKSGSVNENGELVPDSTKVRLENLPITHPYFDVQRTFQFIHQRNMPKEQHGYVPYFYKADGEFISSHDSQSTNTPVGWGLTPIPLQARYMHVVFNTPRVENNIYLEYWMQGVSKNIEVKNSDLGFNRRQGITVGGAHHVKIVNNVIHDMKGAAPESGIDLEAGYNLNNDIEIVENKFFNNARYDVILYDGRNARVEGNHFASKNAIGLAISEPFKYATIIDNHFDGTKVYAYNYAEFKGNRMNNGLAAFLGNELVIDGMEFTDTVVNLAASEPYGIKASNINVINTNNKLHSQFGINANPLHLEDITITGASALDSFSGNATDGSAFNNLKVVGYTRVQLVRGTYTNCVFEAAPGAWGPYINKSGNYVFENCSFKSEHGGLGINSVGGDPDLVLVKNSSFELTGPRAAMTITAGKKVVFEKNTIKANGFTDINKVLWSIGNGYWKRSEPTLVGDVTLKENVIESNLPVKGIQTIYAGLGAPAYILEDNVLYNGTLELRYNDLNNGNQELKKD